MAPYKVLAFSYEGDMHTRYQAGMLAIFYVLSCTSPAYAGWTDTLVRAVGPSLVNRGINYLVRETRGQLARRDNQSPAQQSAPRRSWMPEQMDMPEQNPMPIYQPDPLRVPRGEFMPVRQNETVSPVYFDPPSNNSASTAEPKRTGTAKSTSTSKQVKLAVPPPPKKMMVPPPPPTVPIEDILSIYPKEFGYAPVVESKSSANKDKRSADVASQYPKSDIMPPVAPDFSRRR